MRQSLSCRTQEFSLGSEMPDAPRFRFNYLRILYDPTGYYFQDWSKPVPVSVIASTQAEAKKMVFDLSGKSTRQGFDWLVRLVDVSQIDEQEEVIPEI